MKNITYAAGVLLLNQNFLYVGKDIRHSCHRGKCLNIHKGGKVHQAENHAAIQDIMSMLDGAAHTVQARYVSQFADKLAKALQTFVTFAKKDKRDVLFNDAVDHSEGQGRF